MVPRLRVRTSNPKCEVHNQLFTILKLNDAAIAEYDDLDRMAAVEVETHRARADCRRQADGKDRNPQSCA